MLVCEAQVPFVHGGAEVHVRELVRELNARGYLAELVSVPFKWYPKEEIMPHAAAWRLLDLSESNGRPIDLLSSPRSSRPTSSVIPNKVAWLIHQYRAAYELCGTPYSDFHHTELDVGLRDTLHPPRWRDAAASAGRSTPTPGTPRRGWRNSTASRPSRCIIPRDWPARLQTGDYGDYVLSVGRLESVKRVDLIVRAMADVSPGVRLVVAGDGTQRGNVEAVAEQCGVKPRVDVSRDRERRSARFELYKDALAVVYPPYDEDFGYVTLEAFLSRKPVVTCTDSGGPQRVRRSMA